MNVAFTFSEIVVLVSGAVVVFNAAKRIFDTVFLRKKKDEAIEKSSAEIKEVKTKLEEMADAMVSANESMQYAMRVILGENIDEMYKKAQTHGWCSIDRVQRIERLIRARKAIGGNGDYDAVLENLRKLPLHDPSGKTESED